MRALAAEFRKLFTTRTALWLTVLSVLLAALITILVCINLKTTDESGPGALKGIASIAAGFGYVFSAVLGVIGITGEYRHQTATPTFLSVPVRGVVVAAKLITYLVWGFVLGILNVLVTMVIAVPWLSHRGFTDVSLGAPGVMASLIGAVVVVAIFGIVGVGLGALLRNQIAAIVGLVVYLFIAEPILSSISGIHSVYRYLPGAAASALTGGNLGNNNSVADHLSRAPAGLVLVAYGLVFALLGALITVRRDVT